ncbi:NHLP leader peptide family RiPP precursor [Melittangium boletus]|uniref:Nitrile hydratase n=1 Tax=Melittangium boletus DSM 14713 TaxID=1294270 RepID=A0A250I8N9_9BACT|nr:NHLP leader peptide family RiPP precursor [Melittangium boletus]ATB27522.1 nitrile hydratase [Melittangium boletus DSM 14713]
MDVQALIRKAWDDESFKNALLRDPRAVVEKELGVKLPEEIEIFVHEQTPHTIHLILPQKP